MNGRPTMSNAGALAQLKQFLANCSDDRLAALTARELTMRYRVPEREIECVLLAMQANRRRFLEEQGARP